MILCHCAGISEDCVLGLIADGVSTVAEVTRACGAGACCAPCREEIGKMITAVRPAPKGTGLGAEGGGTLP